MVETRLQRRRKLEDLVAILSGAEGRGEKNDVPDGPKANNQNPCLVRKVREN